MGRIYEAMKRGLQSLGAALGMSAIGTVPAEAAPPKNDEPVNDEPVMEEAQNPTDVYDQVTESRHFEAHGDRWAIVAEQGRGAEGTAEAMAWIMEQEDLEVLKTPLDNIALLMPKGREAAPGCVLRVSEDGKLFMESVFPVLKGLPNEMKCLYGHVWKSSGGAEADLFFEHESGALISLYDPYFALDREAFLKNEPVTMEVAAWAYTVRKAEKDCQILNPESALYKQWRKEHPEAGEEIRAYFKGIRSMLSREYASEFSFRVPVEGVEKLMCANWPMYRIATRFVGEGEGLRGYLYIAERLLGDYIPQVGDDLEGVYWLTGYITRSGDEPPSN